MNNTDQLLVYYDDGTIQARDTTLQLMENQNDLLRRVVKLLESQGTVDSSNRQRITIDASTATVATSLVHPQQFRLLRCHPLHLLLVR